MWKVEREQDSWVISWGGCWMPDTYQSKEEAMEAFLTTLLSGSEMTESENGRV